MSGNTTKIKLNSIKCKKCNQILVSNYDYDFKMCKCGSVGVDGGNSYLRRIGYSKDYIELSKIIEDDKERTINSI